MFNVIVNRFKLFSFIVQRYPFDWSTPIGYLACCFLQIPPIFAAPDLFMYALVLVIGFSLFSQDFISDIELNLHRLNDDLHASEENSPTAKQYMEMKIKLFGIIQFHSEVKQLSVGR